MEENDSKLINIKEDITIKSQNDFQNLFDIASPVIPIFKQILNDKENVIIVTPYENNRLEIISCICELIDNNVKTDLFNNVDDIKYSIARKIIIPSPDANDIIRIFEYLIADSRSYVFSVNIKTFDNVLESMKILISMYLPNLTNKSLEHLLAISHANLVFIDKNEQGLYEIKHIAQIIYEEGRLILQDKISEGITNDIPPKEETLEEMMNA